jgi:hypothetical protein
MSRERRRYALSRLYPESARVVTECIDRSDLPAAVPRIMTLRDTALPSRQQQRCIGSLGGVDGLVCIDTHLDLMHNQPRRLTAILLERCWFRARDPAR